MSNTNTEAACLKFIFTKFTCNVKKAAGTPYTDTYRHKSTYNSHLDVSRLLFEYKYIKYYLST